MIEKEEWRALAAHVYTPMHGETWVDERGDYCPVLRLLEARGQIESGLSLPQILAVVASGARSGPVRTAMKELSYAFGMDYPTLCHFLVEQPDDFNLAITHKAEED